jgi:hypothetical protein
MSDACGRETQRCRSAVQSAPRRRFRSPAAEQFYHWRRNSPIYGYRYPRENPLRRTHLDCTDACQFVEDCPNRNSSPIFAYQGFKPESAPEELLEILMRRSFWYCRRAAPRAAPSRNSKITSFTLRPQSHARPARGSIKVWSAAFAPDRTAAAFDFICRPGRPGRFLA